MDGGGLVGAGVVQHDVYGEVVGDVRIDEVEELAELDSAVLRAGLGDDVASGDVQRSEQVDHAVTLVVMGASFDLSGSHRQRWLSAIQRLDAGLLIHAEHHRVLRRVHVDANDVADLVHELRIRRQLEPVGQPRLETERLPDPTHRRRRDPGLRGQVTRRPMCRVGRGFFQGSDHDRFDISIADRARRSGPRFVDQPIESGLEEPLTPLEHRCRVHPHPLSHVLVRHVIGSEQHDPVTVNGALGPQTDSYF